MVVTARISCEQPSPLRFVRPTVLFAADGSAVKGIEPPHENVLFMRCDC